MDREQKTYDGMTNLPDRMTFFADVKGFGSKLKEGERLPIVLIQLTRLINVNRKYGVKAGDRLLMEIARHLEEKYPGYEAYRIANSRFVLLGPGGDGQGVEELVESLHRRFKQTWPVVQEKETCDIPVKALLVQFYGDLPEFQLYPVAHLHVVAGPDGPAVDGHPLVVAGLVGHRPPLDQPGHLQPLV